MRAAPYLAVYMGCGGRQQRQQQQQAGIDMEEAGTLMPHASIHRQGDFNGRGI